jgi:hypothetical protein
MQPTYIPWAGFFHLAANAVVFVFLDDVQLERQSWQTRNRILAAGREVILSVPLVNSSLSTKINEAQIQRKYDLGSKHLRTIKNSYPDLLRQRLVTDLLADAYESTDNLAKLNSRVLRAFFSLLGIRCETIMASDLECDGVRSEKIANICKRVGASVYISPAGSRGYLEEDGFENNWSIPVVFQNFCPRPYKQRFTNSFQSHLSIVDLIGNCGIQFAKEYIAEEL